MEWHWQAYKRRWRTHYHHYWECFSAAFLWILMTCTCLCAPQLNRFEMNNVLWLSSIHRLPYWIFPLPLPLCLLKFVSSSLLVCKRVSWSSRLSHDTPAVKGDAHCWSLDTCWRTEEQATQHNEVLENGQITECNMICLDLSSQKHFTGMYWHRSSSHMFHLRCEQLTFINLINSVLFNLVVDVTQLDHAVIVDFWLRSGWVRLLKEVIKSIDGRGPRG